MTRRKKNLRPPLAAEPLDATPLVDTFDPRRLRPGLYTAASTDPAYGQAYAMIAAGHPFEGQHFMPLGTQKIAFRAAATPPLSRALNPQIGIAREFFATVLKDYRDWREKWWREAIQNSVDAGATSVLCEATQNEDGTWSIACEDDGIGMDADTLVNKFLMLGATTKVDVGGVAGGFGKAKELLILPWLQWSVETRGQRAVGFGTEYELSSIAERKGTRIEVLMPGDQTTSAQAAMAFLEKCDLPGIRFRIVNRPRETDGFDQAMRAKLRARDLIESVPGRADIYTARVDYTSYHMYIRANGLYMFSSYVGELPKQQILVELTAPSIEILTANRDGFRDYNVASAIDKLAEEVQKDVLSALRRRRGLLRQKYEGKGKFRVEQLQASALSQIGSVAPTRRGRTSIRNMELLVEMVDQLRLSTEDVRVTTSIVGSVPNRELAEQLLAINYKGSEHISEAVKQLVWEPDFYLINEIEGFRIPRKFYPETMQPRVLKLIKVWAELCRFVLMQLGNFQQYGVGFIFSDSAGAAYQPEDGEHWLLLNPYTNVRSRRETWSPSKPEHIRWLYASAVHECTHLADGITYHDESFAAALTRNIAMTADGFRKVRGIVNSIRMAAPPQLEAPEQNPRSVATLRRRLMGR